MTEEPEVIIAALEAENIRLRSMLARAHVIVPPTVARPTLQYTHVLLDMVWRAYPKLRPTKDESPYFLDHFRGALLYLCFVRRQEELNRKYSVHFFVGQANEWFSTFQYSERTSFKPLCAAAVASGIRTSDFSAYPDVEIALAFGPNDKPVEGWREVLRLGAIPPPLPFVNRPRPFNVRGPSEVTLRETR